jgi:hypothetical protein
MKKDNHKYYLHMRAKKNGYKVVPRKKQVSAEVECPDKYVQKLEQEYQYKRHLICF